MVKHEDMLVDASSGINIKRTNASIEKMFFITFGIFTLLTIISLLILTRFNVSATGTTTDTSSATASVNVNAACTLSASGTDSHTTTLSGGQYNGNVGTTTVKSICNDAGGYALYAIGYSNHSYIPTELGSNTDLIWNSSTAGNTSNNIATGTATSGNTSAWSMKLTATGTTNVPTIVSGNNYTVVPSTFTKVAYYPNSTMNPSDPSTHDDGSYLTTTYGIYASPTQAPGTYNGKVKYTLVHPNNAIPQNKYYMQDMTPGLCEVLGHDNNFTVYDRRDENSYTARWLDDHCIMTQNLRYIGGNHGVVEEGIVMNTAGEVFVMQDNTQRSYTSPYYHDSGKTDYGVYYNYCAASGNTLCIDENIAWQFEQADSICPVGWKLPRGVGNNISWGEIPVADILASGDFAVYAGRYTGGNLVLVGETGHWWSGTGLNKSMCALRINADNTTAVCGEYGAPTRDNLISIRCELKE